MVVKARSSIVAARIDPKASPLALLRRQVASPGVQATRSRSQPVYPRLASESATPAPSPSREVCASQYEWDERWDGLS